MERAAQPPSTGPSEPALERHLLKRRPGRREAVFVGTTRQVDGRLFYMASPDYMAKYAKRLIQYSLDWLDDHTLDNDSVYDTINGLGISARVVELEYGPAQSGLPQNGYFSKITIELAAWPKEGVPATTPA